MAKVLIQTEGTEFEQNARDMAIIDDNDRAGIPIMLNASDFNQAYARADEDTKALIHAGGQTEETDPIFTASPAYNITADDISSWNGKQEALVSGTNIKTINNTSILGSGNIDIQGGGGTETDPIFTASPAYGITSEDITSWNNKSTFSGSYTDLTDKPTIPSNTSDLYNDSGFITSNDIPTNISSFNNDSGYITGYTETDPVFSGSAAAGISSTDINNWNGMLTDSGLKFKGVYAASYSYPLVMTGLDPGIYLINNNETTTSQVNSYNFKLKATSSYYDTELLVEALPHAIMIITKEFSTVANGESFAYIYGFSSSTVNKFGTVITVNKVSSNQLSQTKREIPFITDGITSTTYYRNLCEFSAPAYSTSATYSVGDYIYREESGSWKLYQCNTDISTGEVWNSSHWTLVPFDSVNLLNKINSLAPTPQRVFFVDDSELEADYSFTIKGRQPGIYLFEHSVNIKYAPENQAYENLARGIMWLDKYIDPADTAGGPCGGYLPTDVVNDSTSNEYGTITNYGSGMLISIPSMPTTMAGITMSSSGGGTSFVSPRKLYINDFEIDWYDYQSTYNQGDIVAYLNKIWKCNSNNVTGTFNQNYWNQMTLLDYIQEQIPSGTSINLSNGSYVTDADKGIQMNNCTASGMKTIAFGSFTTASQREAAAIGYSTTASGSASIAVGDSTEAKGAYAFAEGFHTIANERQHAQGFYNIDKNYNNTNVIHIVGNGTGANARSNAHTLDKYGNAWFAGDVYVGSTSGTDKDAGSVKLAKESDVPVILSDTIDPGAGAPLPDGTIMLIYTP